MKYLADTNVLSEATKPRPVSQVLDWIRRHESSLVLSPIVVGELLYGILLLPTGKRQTRLLKWFSSGIQSIDVVPIDMTTATEWARLLAELKRSGRAMPIKDSLIAATARQYRLTVATRNVADYRYAGVDLVDPFAD